MYEKLIGIGSIPNATTKTIDTGISGAYYFWIDATYSFAFNSGACYPIPYTDPSNNKNSITARLNTNGTKLTIQTGADWTGYTGYVAVKYTK